MNTDNKLGYEMSEGNQIATCNKSGKKFQAVSTGGQYGCVGCHFNDSEEEFACWGLPCNEAEWADGESRIWEEITTEGE